MLKKIAVIGAGNVGCATAGVLASRGENVCLYSDPSHATRWEGIRTKGKLSLQGALQGECQLLLTTNLKETVQDSEILFITLPAFARESILAQIARYVEKPVIICFIPGSFSTYVVLKYFEGKKVTFVETNSVPFPCRSVVDGVVTVLQPKQSLDVGILSSDHPEEIFALLNRLFGGILHLQNPLISIGLGNPNGVVHPSSAILNLGRIEDTQGDFFFYRQGMTESVAKVAAMIDQDRLEIGRRLGIPLKSLLQIAKDFYGMEFSSMREFAMHSKLHNSVKACPTHIHDRYFTEDIPYVLVPWFCLGEALGVHSRIIKSVIDIGSCIHNTDFLEIGTNLKSMGLDQLNTHLLKKKLRGEI